MVDFQDIPQNYNIGMKQQVVHIGIIQDLVKVYGTILHKSGQKKKREEEQQKPK